MQDFRENFKSSKGSVNEGVLVIIDDYDPLKHRLKVKRAEDGSPLEPDRNIQDKIEQKKSYEVDDKKVFKADDDPKGPIAEITRDYARLAGSPDYGFFSYKEGANFIKGPLSLIAKPGDIRLSAITTLNPLLISCFPSTIVTPLPTCIWSIPGAAAIKPILKSVLIASTLLAATGS